MNKYTLAKHKTLTELLIAAEKRIRMLENQIELLEEDILGVEMFLDDKGIDRYCVVPHAEYSMIGRIELYKQNEVIE